jgi:hypothetical protein
MALTNKQTTFSGVGFPEAKRLVDYEFSGCVIKLDRNHTQRHYEVSLTDKVDKSTVLKFKEHWKKIFIVKVYSLKYEL